MKEKTEFWDEKTVILIVIIIFCSSIGCIVWYNSAYPLNLEKCDNFCKSIEYENTSGGTIKYGCHCYKTECEYSEEYKYNCRRVEKYFDNIEKVTE